MNSTVHAATAHPLTRLAERYTQLSTSAQQAFLHKLQAMGISFQQLPIPAHTPAQARGWPASFAQERLWLQWQLQPSESDYHVCAALQLTGRLDRQRLTQACAALVERHAGLRTCLNMGDDGQLYQSIRADVPPSAQLQWEVLTAAHVDDPTVQATLHTLWQRPFQLDTGEVVRWHVLQLNDHTAILLLVLHHVAADGWSLNILSQQLAALYQQSTLPTAAIALTDYAVWQRHGLATPQAAAEQAYWQQKLAPLPDRAPTRQLQRLADRLQPDGIDDNTVSAPSQRVYFHLPPALSQQILAYCQQHQFTVFVFFLTALNSYLYRQWGVDDVWIGTPIANRQRAEVQDLVGCLINSQVLRTTFTGQMSFRQVQALTQQTCMEAQIYQELPYEQVVEQYFQQQQRERPQGLFDVMYSHQPQARLPDFVDVAVQELTLLRTDSKSTLTLGTTQDEHGHVSGMWVYRTDLIHADTLQRWSGQWLDWLSLILAQPDQPLAHMDLQPVRALPEHPVHTTPNVVHTIAAIAQRTPDAWALIDSKCRWSYAQMEQRANQMAHWLLAQGLVAEQRVAVAWPRSAELFIVLLAILKAGGVYVPLDLQLPSERLSWLQADAGCTWLWVDSVWAAHTDPIPCAPHTTILMATDDCWQHYPSTTPKVRQHPQQLAYLIYTSGSTGQPKGVAVAHAALAMHVAAIGQLYGLTAQDVVLHNIAISFDGATEGWLTALSHGAAVLISPQQLLTPRQMNQLICQYKVSIVGMTPAYLLQMAEDFAQWDTTMQAGYTVRSFTVGGEAISREQALYLRQVFQPKQLINGYGPTETVITPLLWRADAYTPIDEWQQSTYLPIGQAVGGRELWILNDVFEPVPDGQYGELWIAGILARGYWARPALTAERFIPHPFASYAGQRLYRTGDVVRRLPSGDLEYLGRIDQQIKIRGLRIELGEIEARLHQCTGVAAATVLAVGEGLQRHLVAYVVSTQAVTVLQDQLLAQLPAWMVPQVWVVLPEIPRFSSGKVNRQALLHATHTQQRNTSTTREQRPLTATEQHLAQLWRNLLTVDTLSPDDNFFALGGHSLLATRLGLHIKQQFGCELPLADLFAYPQLAAMAQRIQQHPQPISQTTWSVLKSAPSARLVLSPMQQNLWAWQRQQRNHPAYHLFGAVHLHGALSTEGLQQRWTALGQRYPLLRLGIDATDPMHPVHQQQMMPIQVQYLDAPLAWQHPTQRHQDLQHAAEQPFAWDGSPLWRVQCYALGADEHILLITTHHLIADGVSLQMILGDFLNDHDLTPRTLTYDFQDWVLCHQAWLDRGERQRQLAWWQQRLTAASADPLPAVLTWQHQGQRQRVQIAPDQAAALHQLAQQVHVTVATLWLWIWAKTLSVHLADVQPLYVGMPVACRQHPDSADLTGLLLNFLPIQVHTQGIWLDNIKQLQRDSLDMQSYADVGLTEIEQACGHAPLFRSLFNYLTPTHLPTRAWGALQLTPVPIATRHLAYELECDVSCDDQGEVWLALGVATHWQAWLMPLQQQFLQQLKEVLAQHLAPT